MSPALISGTVVCVLPCSRTRFPSRSGRSFVKLWTVESDFSVPETTRNIVMRPANGSAPVFHTNAAAGPPPGAAGPLDRGGHLRLGGPAALVGREGPGLHRHQIHHAAEGLLFANRQLDGHRGA